MAGAFFRILQSWFRINLRLCQSRPRIPHADLSLPLVCIGVIQAAWANNRSPPISDLQAGNGLGPLRFKQGRRSDFSKGPHWGRFLSAPVARTTNIHRVSRFPCELGIRVLSRRQNTLMPLRSAILLGYGKRSQIRIAHFSKGRSGAAVTCLEKAAGTAVRDALLRERARNCSLRVARGLPALGWRQEREQGHQ